MACVWLYRMALFFVSIFTCFENNEDNIINKISTQNTPYCTIYFIFLAVAASEFRNHVIDTVMKIPYHYFYIKNKHFGNY